ncbi:MAG TPA: hypothetical protein VEM77_09475 [Thermoplasmata archaeon]|nr:hypothetical protein [Thermoplasmata archaeon]
MRGIATTPCPVCGGPLAWNAQNNQWWCGNERKYYPPGGPPATVTTSTSTPSALAAMAASAQSVPALWTQNFYRIRKKVLALAGQYWIEDQARNQLAYSKQKLLRLKEDIRVYADETLAKELFQIRQTQILDIWGTFAIVDSSTNAILGYIRRRALASSLVADEWEMRDPYNNLVGEIKESTGRGLARKYIPGGGLIPEKLTMTLGGQPIATINQQFKIIGDIWEIQCLNVPSTFDRRVFLGGVLLMGMIERARK